ncbi:putative pectinesterase [Helianthus anomalus]
MGCSIEQPVRSASLFDRNSSSIRFVPFLRFSRRSLECSLHSVAGTYGANAAYHRNSVGEDAGFSFVNCSVTKSGLAIFLGRAWRNYSRAVYSYCDIDNIIDPSGWNDWNQPWRQRIAVLENMSAEEKVQIERHAYLGPSHSGLKNQFIFLIQILLVEK